MAANFAKLLEDDGFLAVFNKRSVESNAIGVVLIASAVLWRKAAAPQRRINRLGDPSRRTARNALAPGAISGNMKVRNRDAPHVARETWTVKFDAKVVGSFTDAHLAHAVKIVGISDDIELVAACEKVAQNALGERRARRARSRTTSTIRAPMAGTEPKKLVYFAAGPLVGT